MPIVLDDSAWPILRSAVAPATIESFDAFATGFNGGVSVASADLNQDGKADIIAGKIKVADYMADNACKY